LDLLAKPAARLRCIEPVGRDRRALEVIHLPAREERAGDFPLLACAIRGKNECALAGADEDSDAAHNLYAAFSMGTVTIQPMPKRSVTMPKQGDQKVLPMGICTWPPLANALK